jgi:hypothetical protein
MAKSSCLQTKRKLKVTLPALVAIAAPLGIILSATSQISILAK